MTASRQTRDARADLAGARDAEAAHRRDCLDCIRAASRCKPADRCDAGKALAAAVRAAERRWQDERDLDRAVPPGQQALW